MQQDKDELLDMRIMDFFTKERLQEADGKASGTRAYNALCQSVCDDLEHGAEDSLRAFIASHTKNHLRRINNAGSKSVEVILLALERAGFSL